MGEELQDGVFETKPLMPTVYARAELLSRLANAVIQTEKFNTGTAERSANVNCVKCADGFRRKRTPRSINDF